MTAILVPLLAYVAIIGSHPDATLTNAFICDNVDMADLPRLTEKAQQGETHLVGNGSGFFITEDGYLITNHHVVDGAAELVVVNDGTAYLAELRAKNAKRDLALLKINAFRQTGNGVQNVHFTPLSRSSDKTCRVGQSVLVVGFPQIDLQGLEPKVTRGIVSSLSGFKGEKNNFQMDAAIQGGNSGGPVVDEWGELVGVAVAKLEGGENVNYAITLEELIAFLPKHIKFSPSTIRRRRDYADIAENVIKSTALILKYAKGSHGKIDMRADNAAQRETITMLRQAIISAKLHKLHKEWDKLRRLTDSILAQHGEVEDIREMNNLARDELGLHLTIIAETDGNDVPAIIHPICGFKDKYVECERPTAVFDKVEQRHFPIEAKLTYEDDDWFWAGTLKCVYNWHGTKEIRVKLKHVSKK